MARVRYEPDREGMQAMMMGPDMAAGMVRVAEAGKTHAEGLAASFAETGHYARSFRVEERAYLPMGRMTARVGAMLVNDADYAASLEFKPGAHKVLARTRAWMDAEFGREGRR